MLANIDMVAYQQNKVMIPLRKGYLHKITTQASIYLFKIKNRNNEAMGKICP